ARHADVDVQKVQEPPRPAADAHPPRMRVEARKREEDGAEAAREVQRDARDPPEPSHRDVNAAARLPETFAERFAVARGDGLAIDGVILAAARRDLDRTEHRRELPGALPVPSGGDAVQKTGAVGVAATGRVDDGGRPSRCNGMRRAVRVNDRAFTAERDDER